jgi:GcrA cell cycle regulator
MTTWMREECSLLAVLYADGLSAAAIGDRIGCSRNAVLGKMHRMRRDGVLAQRNAHTTLYAGLLKQHGSVVEGRKAQARANGARPEPYGSSPTVTRKVAADLGISDETVRNRVKNSTKLAAISSPCTLLELGRHSCRWPIGDPQDTAFRFCGAVALDGCPYCSAHTTLSLRRDAA